MVNKKLISRNIIFSLLQILTNGLVYYFLYKYLVNSLGADLMGVWAIVLSISSTANVANLGIGSGVIRYTAKYKANNDYEKIERLVHTSLIFLSSLFTVILLIIFFIAPIWLRAIIEESFYAEALSLLPFSLVCLLLNALSGIFLSCIDGFQKNYIRSVLVIISGLLLLFFTFLLVPRFGLLGVAYAQLIQACFLWISAIVSLKTVFKPFRVFSPAWDRAVFRDIFSFGYKEQIISICQLCFDPFTKSMLSSFGTLSLVTYYEMANRLVTQLRSFLISINQVFMPVLTNANEQDPGNTQTLYKEIFKVNFFLSVLWLSFIIAAAVPVSKVWIGALNYDFVLMVIILALGYFFNIGTSLAYFANMAMANLNPNVVSNILMALLNLLLCFLLGYLFGGLGVALGWSLALAVGAVYVGLRYHATHRLVWRDLFTKSDLVLVFLGITNALLCLGFFYWKNEMNVWLMFAVQIVVFLLICLLLYFIHPVSNKLKGMLR